MQEKASWLPKIKQIEILYTTDLNNF